MSNPTKLNFFGLPIDDGVRNSSLSRLKLLARKFRERANLNDSIATCRNGIRESEAALAALNAEKPVNENADKKAREYAENELKATPDPRVVFKNRAIFVVWLLAFGFLMVTQVFAKAFPGMYVWGDISIYICLLIAYGVMAVGIFYTLILRTTAEYSKYISWYLLPAMASTAIAAVPAGIFYGTLKMAEGAFPMPVNEIVKLCLPAFLVCVAALLISGLLDIPMSKMKPSKKQQKAYDNAYAEEYARLNKESSDKKQKHDKAFSSASERLTTLKAKLEKAEAELEKTEAEIENDDTVPEYYKDRDILSRLIMYLENSDADSLVSAVRIFEAHRSQEMFIKYQTAQADLTKIEAEVKEWKKFRTVYNYESKDRAAKIAELNRQAAANREEANDIYRSLGKDKRV